MTTNLDPPTAAPVDATPATSSPAPPADTRMHRWYCRPTDTSPALATFDVMPAPPDPGVRQGGPLGTGLRRVLGAGAVLVVAAVAFAIGNAATGSEAAPTNRTPAVCLTALDDAERVVSLAHTGMGYEADAMRAAGELDAAGIDEQTANIAALTPQVQAAVDTYNADAAQCRSAGPAS